MTRSRDDLTAFPSYEVYAWHHRCSQCNADAGTRCVAPRKQATHDRMNSSFTNAGFPEKTAPEYGFMHARRIDAGINHRMRDVGNAPWRDEREPGRSYDSLPRPLLPPPDCDQS